jgi:hypothetical protein
VIKKKNLRPYLILITIIIISFFLRFYRLDQNVPQLYSDELDHLNMLRILDQPLSLQNLINKFLYFPFTFTWFLGTGVFAIRSASAFYGSLIPLFIFFFVKSLDKKNIHLPLVASGLSAILPWSFMISRIAHAHIPIIVILSLIHLTLVIKAKKISHYLVSLAPLFLASIYYPSIIIISLIITPLYVFYLYTNTQSVKLKKTIITVSTIFLLAIGLVLFTRYKGFNEKSRGVSLVITSDVNVTAETNLYRGYSRLTSPSIFSFNLPTEKITNKLLYNFPLAVTRQFTENYLSFFSPDFLFLKGDNILRHSTGQLGVFFPCLLPFLLYGTFVFFTKAKKKTKKLLLLWIIVSPIPSSLTNDGAYYLLRAITLLPILTYLIALGLHEFISLLKGKLKIASLSLVVFLISFSAYNFFFGYFHVYPTISAQSYEHGFKGLSDFQVKNKDESLLVLWQGYYPNVYFHYYQRKVSPRSLGYQRQEIMVGESTFHQTFDNLYFAWPQSPEDLSLFLNKEKISYLVFPKDYLSNHPQYQLPFLLPVEKILLPDQSSAFTIFKVANQR